jgi:hypothetical protein
MMEDQYGLGGWRRPENAVVRLPGDTPGG